MYDIWDCFSTFLTSFVALDWFFLLVASALFYGIIAFIKWIIWR
jgi:hypothetical protein